MNVQVLYRLFLILRLDALERAQHNGIMEQTAPEGAHSPLTCASILLPLGGVELIFY